MSIVDNCKYERNEEKEDENDTDLENDQRCVRWHRKVINNEKSDKV